MDHGPKVREKEKEENKITSLHTVCVRLYIRDTKEEKEDKVGIESVSERGSGGSDGEGVVKGNGGGKRERPKTETTKSATRHGEIEIRDERREEERGQSPLLRRVDSNADDISTNQITPRAPPFIIILLVFPLLHPHWMTFPGPYRGGQKRHPLSEENSMLSPGVCVLRWYPSVVPTTLVQRTNLLFLLLFLFLLLQEIPLPPLMHGLTLSVPRARAKLIHGELVRDAVMDFDGVAV